MSKSLRPLPTDVWGSDLMNENKLSTEAVKSWSTGAVAGSCEMWWLLLFLVRRREVVVATSLAGKIIVLTGVFDVMDGGLDSLSGGLPGPGKLATMCIVRVASAALAVADM